MPDKSWPFFPIAASGHSYFVLSQGYDLAGVPEEPGHYLAYCRATGSFRKKPIPVPTRATATADALALRASRAWKVLKWIDHGHNWSYTLDETMVFDAIQAQADSIQ